MLCWVGDDLSCFSRSERSLSLGYRAKIKICLAWPCSALGK